MVYRLVFAGLFVLMAAVVGLYRHRAQEGRRIDYSKEGSALFAALRLGGLALWLYCLLYVFYPRPLGWSFVALPTAARWAGAALVLAILPLVVAAPARQTRGI